MKTFDACYRIPQDQEPPRLGSCVTVRVAGEKAWNVRVVGLTIDESADEIEVQLGSKPEPHEVGPLTEGVARRVSGYTLRSSIVAGCAEEANAASADSLAGETRTFRELLQEPGFVEAAEQFLGSYLHRFSQANNSGPIF